MPTGVLKARVAGVWTPILPGGSVQIIAGGDVAVGSIVLYAGATAPPGYLICDGAAVSRVDYSHLFTAIGTVWGAGDGSTTFNLPDLRGRVPLGAGQGTGLTNRAMAAKLGAETVQLTLPEVPAHQHDMTHDHPGSTTGLVSNDHSHGVSIQSGGQSQSHYHVPLDGTRPYFVVQGLSGGASGIQSINAGVLGPGNDTSTNWASHDHSHGVNGNTGGISANHNHGTSTPTRSAATGSAGSGTAHENMPPAAVIQYIIRASPAGGASAGDEVWVSPATPTDPTTELWYDVDEVPGAVPAPTTGVLKAKVANEWVIVAGGGSGGGTGTNEVTVGTDAPTDTTELWYDTDALATAPGVGLLAGGQVGQALVKKTAVDYDTEWKTVGTIPPGGTAGQVLAKNTSTDFDVGWTADKNPQTFRAFLAVNTSVPAAGGLDVVTLSVPVTPAGTILMATFSTAYLHPSGITGAFDLAYQLGSQYCVDQRNDGSGTSKCTSMTLVGLSTGAGLTAKIVINNWGGQATNFYGVFTNIIVLAVTP